MTEDEQFENSRQMLLEHEQEMERALDHLIPRAGSGMEVRGSYPVFLFSRKLDDAEDAEDTPSPFQLQYKRAASSITFTRGRVQAGSYVVVPTIGVLPVDDPGAFLPFQAAGGQVFAEYKWTLDPALTAPDWADVFVSCELIQIALGLPSPADVLPATGFNAGVSGTTGVCHGFLMAYNSDGEIITYGQSAIRLPDPDDAAPSEVVIFAYPLVRYVD